MSDLLSIPAKHPRLSLCLYAGLLPLFAKHLAPVGMVEPFALQFAGSASCGKSRAVQLARALWTHPIEGNQVRVTVSGLSTWDGCSSERPEVVLRQVGDWLGTKKGSLVLILDGSVPDPLAEGGNHPAMGRIITLWGSPFGRIGVQGALDSDLLLEACLTHHGKLGPRVKEAIAGAPDHAHARWRDLYRETRHAYVERAAAYGPIQARLATHLAGIAVTAQLLHALLPDEFTWDWGPSIQDAWTWLCLSRDRSNAATYASELVYDWAGRNQHRIANVACPGAKPPVGGFAGMADPEANLLYLTRRWLDETLRDEGLDPIKVTKEWLESGQAFQPGEGDSWRVVIPGQGRVRCVALPLDPVPVSASVVQP